MNKAIKYTKKYLYSVGVGISTLLAAILGAPPSMSLCAWIWLGATHYRPYGQHWSKTCAYAVVDGIDGVFEKTTGEQTHCFNSWLAWNRSRKQPEMNFHD